MKRQTSSSSGIKWILFNAIFDPGVGTRPWSCSFVHFLPPPPFLIFLSWGVSIEISNLLQILERVFSKIGYYAPGVDVFFYLFTTITLRIFSEPLGSLRNCYIILALLTTEELGILPFSSLFFFSLYIIFTSCPRRNRKTKNVSLLMNLQLHAENATDCRSTLRVTGDNR